jgi:hypothetical protein
MLINDNNSLLFYNFENLKKYILLNGLNDFYSNEKLNGFDITDLHSSRIAVLVIRKGTDLDEFLKLWFQTKDKEKLILLL